ncbi:replication-relaxation family protein [Peribacillus frigoritolerans]|uniref:replication-relaxation family protein n=1 Tax=Peribacillus frigoritolerans TaxID=450367 RepID=UPI0021A58CBB|nr:replication-relaxation family protein [Peribacillus frigoritolerans]MCT1390125.1 replication-relaxation family protein [Peribacillus frigoritolerans]
MKNIQPANLPDIKTDKGNQVKMKYLVLTEHDKDLLVKLHDFIYLDSDFIQEYVITVYASKSTLLQRLRALEEAGYIKSFNVPVEGVNRAINVYTLSPFGVEIVEQIQGFVKWNNRWSSRVLPWYQHQLMLNRVVMKFSIQAEEAGLPVKEWIPEARATWTYTKSKTDVIKPDGILVIGAEGSRDNIGLFIELERSVAKRQNTIQKVIRYNDFLNRDQRLFDDYDMYVGFEAPISDWRVLFIGGNEANTRKTIHDILSIKNMEIEAPVLVASLKDVESQAFGEIYHHVLDEKPLQKKML